MKPFTFCLLLLSLFGCGPRSTPPVEHSSAWLGQAQRELAAREYRPSETRRGLQAPNRQHDLRTYFEPTGIRVVDRTAPGSPQLIALSLAGVGRGEELAPVARGVLSHEGDRVEIGRDDVVEWYVNSPEGLEQGMTLAARPAGEGALEIEVSVDGATVSHWQDGLSFRSDAGRRLRYDKLHVEDAERSAIPAHFVLADAGFRIVVEDDGAAYPLVIDPLLTASWDNEIESNEIGAFLGRGVASAGDVNGDGYADVIVGAYRYDAGQSDEGAAFIFHGGPNGIGDSNPINADTLLESNQAASVFGRDVDSAGDVNGDGYDDVIVGAYKYETVGAPTDEGAAWVFLGGPSGVADGSPATAHAEFHGDQATSRFGIDVAHAGDVNGDGYGDILIGASLYDVFGLTDQGSAFVYLGSATGLADGTPSSAHSHFRSDQAGAQLGLNLASAGDINADGYDDIILAAALYTDLFFEEGLVLVFHGSAAGTIGSGGPASADFERAGFQVSARFGSSVAAAGDVNGDGYGDVVVGSYLYNLGVDPEDVDEGAAFVFHGSASGLPIIIESAVLDSNQTSARFGWSVASAGDVNGDGYADVVVGAFAYDDSEIDAGAAFVYLGSADGIPSGGPGVAYAQLESNQANAQLGVQVASAGDVNGDGYDDLIVGAYLYDGPQTDEGQAFVYHGGGTGIQDGNPLTAHARFESNQSLAELGTSVASAGDVNGDGYDDVIIGAPLYDAGENSEGAAFVFLGGAAGIADGDPGTAHAQLESDQANAFLGERVASAGDVNGDGYADVIVGAPSYDAGENNEGAAFVFLGSAAGIADGDPGTAHAQLESDQVSALMGFSVASAGDVNGDGYADVIVGAHFYDAGESTEGAAFVFLGSVVGIADGDPGTAHAQIESDQVSALMGASVASAGDVNGDGYADVIIGAPLYDAGENSEGAAFVFLGSAAGIADGDPGTAHAQLESNQVSANLGISVASAGDVNGDGYADVIVGAPNYGAGESAEGAAFVFLGSAVGIADGDPGTAHAQLESDQVSANLGISVASAGDVNGDSYADVIVGARLHNAGETREGAAFVFLGNAEGRLVRARQLRGDGSGIPVQPWGSSLDDDSFQVELDITSPRGRERAKLEIEACPLGVAFGDLSCDIHLSSSWVDLGTSGASFTETISGLAEGELYHWRARGLYVPLHATEPGITPIPRSGPWRRIAGGGGNADIRMVPEPNALLCLVAGVVLLGFLRRIAKEVEQCA